MLRKRTTLMVLSATAVLMILVSAAPVRGVGPYCDGYCAPYVPCSASCFDEFAEATTCGAWGEAPCGICVCTAYWWGSSSGDTHHGTSSNDCFYAFGGDDTLYGESGNDCIRAGSGNDTVFGGSGNDCLYGESGSDYLNGGTGHDLCYTGETYVSCND